MPPSTRRQAHTRLRDQAGEAIDTSTVDVPSEGMNSHATPVPATGIVQMEVEDPEIDEDESEEDAFEMEPFPPPGLKEISSLASWTVSSAKPGNGVSALRAADTSQFWQSDGPQPHLLSIHFFKLVSIVHMRIYLDFHADESYTPIKIQFLAGMGVHDIQEFAEMTFDQPAGWIDIDFSRVGVIESDDEDEDANPHKETDWSKRPVLRAFLVQVRILENHQNGKDTHLRAVQLFARDESQEIRNVKTSPTKSLGALPLRTGFGGHAKDMESNNIKLASWMQDPDLR